MMPIPAVPLNWRPSLWRRLWDRTPWGKRRFRRLLKDVNKAIARWREQDPYWCFPPRPTHQPNPNAGGNHLPNA